MTEDRQFSAWRVRFGVVACALMCFSACGRDATSVDGGPTLSIEAGGAGSDTVDAEPLQALVFQVIGDQGEPEAGLQVVLRCHGVLLNLVERGHPTCNDVIRTDGRGRGSIPLKYGSTAGEASIDIQVPVYGIEGTARYTVRPGAPENLTVAPTDTAVMVGSTVTLRAGNALDRYGNPVQDGWTLASTSPAVAVEGLTVHGVEPGIGLIGLPGSTGEISTLARVVVVPPDTVVWTIPGEGLVSGDLTGESGELLAGPAADPAWSHDGETLVFVRDDQLYLLDSSGDLTHVNTGLNLNRRPEFSQDGVWIYFQSAGIFRVHPDGTGLERISPEGSTGRSPTVSPDGTRVAYTDGSNIVVQPIGGDPVTIFGPSYVPDLAWSPNGEWVALVVADADEVWVVRPDGRDAHQVGMHGTGDGIVWSPDSRWIVGALIDAALFDVENNVSARLGWNAQRASFAWRP